MSSTYDKLKYLRKVLTIKGEENYLKSGVNIVVSNHVCLKDIFYLPASLTEESISMISSRLMYKKINNRQKQIYSLLNPLPIEAHGGGGVYADLCLKQAIYVLERGIPISIFPEGAYVEKDKIYRGRTGVARILFNAYNKGINVNLIPVSISYKNTIEDLDNYELGNDKVEITILPAVDFQEEYNQFIYSNYKFEKNIAMHKVVDKAMSEIAINLDKAFESQYIELYSKGNVIFSDGNTVITDLAQNDNYLNFYEESLKKYTENLVRRLKKDN